MFCNNKVPVLVSYKNFLWFKLFKKYEYKPCGLCPGCRSFKTMVEVQKFKDENPRSTNWSELI